MLLSLNLALLTCHQLDRIRLQNVVGMTTLVVITSPILLRVVDLMILVMTICPQTALGAMRMVKMTATVQEAGPLEIIPILMTATLTQTEIWPLVLQVAPAMLMLAS